MYSFLKGIVAEISETELVLELNNIGYSIGMTPISLATLKRGEEIVVYTRLIVREDDISLCGFLSKEERTLFDELKTVSKIGVKTALAILSSSDTNDFIKAVISEDLSYLVKLPGVGKKTAERLVVELRDKFKKTYSTLNLSLKETSSRENDINSDLVDALTGLGFNKSEINFMCKGLDKDLSVEEALKYALQNRTRR